MTSKWPRFPTDYLESRKESICEQVNQHNFNVHDLHDWLLKRGPWISKNQLRDALSDWYDLEPSNWRPLAAHFDAHRLRNHANSPPRNQTNLPLTVDELLEDYGNFSLRNHCNEERGDLSDDRDSVYDDDGRSGYGNQRGSYDRRDDYQEQKDGYGNVSNGDRNWQNDTQFRNEERIDITRARNVGYGNFNDKSPGQDDRRDRPSVRRYHSTDNCVDSWRDRDSRASDYEIRTSRAISSDLDGDRYHQDRNGGYGIDRRSDPIPSRPRQAPFPNPYRPGLGQTMSSKYQPGLNSQKITEEMENLAKHRSHNFFELYKTWTPQDVPEDVWEESNTPPPQKPYPVTEDRPVTQAPNVTTRKERKECEEREKKKKEGRESDVWGQGSDSEEEEDVMAEVEEEKDREELVRCEKEYNKYDWEVFMQDIQKS